MRSLHNLLLLVLRIVGSDGLPHDFGQFASRESGEILFHEWNLTIWPRSPSANIQARDYSHNRSTEHQNSAKASLNDGTGQAIPATLKQTASRRQVASGRAPGATLRVLAKEALPVISIVSGAGSPSSPCLASHVCGVTNVL